MTKEEAKIWLNKLYTRTDITDEYGDMEDMQPYEEAIDMAIKALEQQLKTGHWIRVTDKADYLVWECDKCGWQQRFNTNYCPDCGVRMVETY